MTDEEKRALAHLLAVMMDKPMTLWTQFGNWLFRDVEGWWEEWYDIRRTFRAIGRIHKQFRDMTEEQFQKLKADYVSHYTPFPQP